MNSNLKEFTVKEIIADDIRWPTSLQKDGSDAMHSDPDYSCVYVTISLQNGIYGNGLTFTLGRGTEIVQKAVQELSRLLEDKNVLDIFKNFKSFWREITSDTQLRWIGPEKGVIHLATAAILNALWDLWAKIENKPVWRLLVDMKPEDLVSTLDFRYVSDVITPDECIKRLSLMSLSKTERLNDLLTNGFPAYTTQVGWIGYNDEKITSLTKEYLTKGFRAFKIKVGGNIDNDIRRCKLIRSIIGDDNILMLDANQVWDVNEAIEWIKKLAEFKPLWIEEPTSPDDILGHKTISNAIKENHIGVATGEMCANRVMFKQFLQSGAMQFCQVDSARIGGINEILLVYLMADKLKIKVCPHAGGIGLCEMVQHLQMWDYVCLSGTKDGKWIEYVDQQHDQFVNPAIVENASYRAPLLPGYSTELKDDVVKKQKYPNGDEWQKLFESGVFKLVKK